MHDQLKPRRNASLDTIGMDTEDGAPGAAAGLDGDAILRLAHQHDQVGPSASELAFGTQRETAAEADVVTAPAAAKKKQPTSSHDGGFTGFGAEFQPYSYTDPHENHGKLDRAVERLGAQHVRMFVPLGAVTTGLLGVAGTDYGKANVDHLAAAVQADPANDDLQRRLKNAQKQYAQDVSYTHSFVKTLALAGKHTTINLTFNGAVGHDNRTDQLAQLVTYLVHQGYERLQVTLENEANGPDQGDGFRGRFNKAIAGHDKKAADAAAHEYVDAYHRLNDDLVHAQVRENVSVIGGDMVANNRAQFFETITREGLNDVVDGYSFHIYWGAGATHSFKNTLHHLEEIKQQAAKWAKGKPISITEFGKERFATDKEKAHDPSHKGVHAVEQGAGAAFEQGLFALTAVNIGYTGLVKWDAFYGGEHHKGDGKGDPGQFYMIGGPGKDYATDATYRLMRMFTHATEPGWKVTGTNHSDQGAESHFTSADGKDGAVLAMSARGQSIDIKALPHGRKLYVTTWNTKGDGDLHTHVVEPGHRSPVTVPRGGAVAVSTRSMA